MANPEVIIRVWGGIGNQLFQIVFGEYISYKHGLNVIFDVASFGKSDKLRKMEIQLLYPNISLFQAPSFFFSKHTGILSRIIKSANLQGIKYIEEKDFIEGIFLNFSTIEKIYLQGYWQNDVYSKFIKTVNPKLFEPKEAIPNSIADLIDEINCFDNSIGIHIRRGDYFIRKNVKIYGVCTDSYYLEGMKIIERKIPSPKYFVFSDDIEWVKKNLKFNYSVTFVENADINSYWYIYLMQKCHHLIISNSSFSWWGAFLNNQEDKIVICPMKWTLNNNKTIALDDWLKI